MKATSWFLLAAGTNEQSIVFTATPPGPGEPGWVGIDIIGATDATLLEYCVIENGRASAATPNDRGGGIYILNANPVIRNCIIRNNSVSRWGGAIYGENANPLHVFSIPGTYNVILLVTDDKGAVADAHLEITVLDALPHLFIGSQQITRPKIFGSIYRTRDIVFITDQDGNPVPNALVAIEYTGPNEGSVTGYTASNGKVTFLTNYSWTSAGTWCFKVTGVSKDGFVFNPRESETRACAGK